MVKSDKIAIFENEYPSIENAFKYVNKRYFDNKYILENYPSSQSFGDIGKLSEFEYAFIDIDLSSRSNLDGFSLIKEVHERGVQLTKIIILTGLNEIEVTKKLEEMNIANLPIITKPLSFKDLQNVLSRSPRYVT
jgi:DNA-binding NtrC family response regulator